MPEFKVQDFSGGITDNYIDGAPNTAKKMDNLLINRFGKPYQRPAFDIYNSSAPQIPPGNQAVDSLYYYDSTLFVKSGTKLYYIEDDDTSWTTLAGPSHDAFADSKLGAKCSWSVWKGHVFITSGPATSSVGGSRTVKVYRDSSGAWTLVQAGMPDMKDAISTTLQVTPGTAAAGAITYSYVWYTLFYRSYVAKVNGVNVTFIDYGTPTVLEVSGVEEFAGDTDPSTTIGNPSYTNGTYENYDTDNIAVQVYRTKKNGIDPYLALDEAQGTDLVDATADSALGKDLYAGASEGNFNSPPPPCYFSAIADSYGWYAAGIDLDDANSALHVNRVWQSKPGDIDSVPGENFVDVEGDKITALSFAGPSPVVFCRNRTYRIDGRFDSSGGGYLRAVLVSAVEGAVSQEVAKTTNGIYFMSENGFCYTDGYKVVNLTKSHLKSTYSDFSSIYNGAAAYDARNGRVYFGVESSLGTASGNNNSLFILDENLAVQDRGTFTTASAGANLQPVSLHYDSANDRILIGDKRGYVFVFDEDKKSDPVVETAVSYASWNRTAVIYDYISAAWSFGDSVLTKWVTKLYGVFKNLTGDLSSDLSSINDDKSSSKSMKAIRERTTTSRGLHRVKRWFPKNSLRCTYKQVRIKKGLVTIAASDDYALATTNTSGKTVLLASGTWPDDGSETLVGHSIYFESDSYAAGYVISVQSGDTLTLATTPPAVTAGKWEIKGYPKDEGFEMHSLSVDYDFIQNTYTAFATGDDGGNK